MTLRQFVAVWVLIAVGSFMGTWINQTDIEMSCRDRGFAELKVAALGQDHKVIINCEVSK